MVAMGNRQQFRTTYRAPRGAETRPGYPIARAGSLFLDIVNFMNFAACRPLPPLKLGAA